MAEKYQIEIDQNGNILRSAGDASVDDTNIDLIPNSIDITKVEFQSLSTVFGVFNKKWDTVNNQLIINPDYSITGLELLKTKVCQEIDKNTENIILNSGYTFKGALLSSSKTHQAELDSAHTNRSDPAMVYPYTVSSKDNKTQITIDNATDLHNQYLALFKDLIMTTKQLGNIEKAKVNIMSTIAEVEAYIDPRI